MGILQRGTQKGGKTGEGVKSGRGKLRGEDFLIGGDSEGVTRMGETQKGKT